MNISLKISDKNTEKTINLGELCNLLGINEAELQGLSLNIEKHGANLKAAVNLDDNYPGLSIDGETQDEVYYLATVELPNNDYPLAYTSRLYAGRSDTETDCPIAMVLSNICEESAFGDVYDRALRCVYIDEAFAVGNPGLALSLISMAVLLNTSFPFIAPKNGTFVALRMINSSITLALLEKRLSSGKSAKLMVVMVPNMASLTSTK